MQGHENIQKVLEKRMERAWNVNLDNGCVDAQSSENRGVLLLVTGTLVSKTEPPKQVGCFFVLFFFEIVRCLAVLDVRTYARIVFSFDARRDVHASIVLVWRHKRDNEAACT